MFSLAVVSATALTTPLTGASAALILPRAETDCWRPTLDDVDRISWGRNAKKKGTGSRGVPHRLNDDERSLYDFARRKGFVEIGGSGWRRRRSDAPLVNTYRSWCDARAVAAYAWRWRRGASLSDGNGACWHESALLNNS